MSAVDMRHEKTAFPFINQFDIIYSLFDNGLI